MRRRRAARSPPRAISCDCRRGSSRPTTSSRISRRLWRRFALAPRSTVSLPKPIDLLHRGLTHNVGCYLVETDDGLALFDCGPTPCIPALEAGLADRGFELGDVSQLLLSHIHFDHAGATGALVRKYPSLQVHVSAVGAPHLVDPTRLEASARRLYGDTFDALWGELVPVPAENIHVVGAVVLGLQCCPTTARSTRATRWEFASRPGASFCPRPRRPTSISRPGRRRSWRRNAASRPGSR